MRKLLAYSIIGVLFVSVVGTIFHFVYEISGENYLVGLIAPVNESVWEHIKLLFFPMLLFSLLTYLPLKSNYPCIGSAYSAGIITGSLLIPILFYTYEGILGYSLLVIDVILFYVCVIIAFTVVYKGAKKCTFKNYSFFLKVIIFVMASALIIFSFNPPNLNIFVPPQSSSKTDKAEDSIVNYIEELSVDILRN